MHTTVLEHFGVNPSDLLGEGIEAWVYALDDQRVLRLSKGVTSDRIAERAAFLALIGRARFSFAIPEALDGGIRAGIGYVIERRIPGRPLDVALRTLQGEPRRAALRNFVLAIDELAAARFDDLPFGDLFRADSVQADSWAAFLRRRTGAVLAASGVREKLQRDIPNLPSVLDRFEREIETLLEGYDEKRLVHGDYYPANVLIGEDLRITGLLDFGTLSVIGDPDMDRAGALAYLDDQMTAWATPQDIDAVRETLLDLRGIEVLRKIRLYTLYYALIFADCEPFDPRTYRWCIRMLTQFG